MPGRCAQQRFLGSEAVVDEAAAVASTLTDSAQGDALDARLCNQLESRADQALIRECRTLGATELPRRFLAFDLDGFHGWTLSLHDRERCCSEKKSRSATNE